MKSYKDKFHKYRTSSINALRRDKQDYIYFLVAVLCGETATGQGERGSPKIVV